MYFLNIILDGLNILLSLFFCFFFLFKYCLFITIIIIIIVLMFKFKSKTWNVYTTSPVLSSSSELSAYHSSSSVSFVYSLLYFIFILFFLKKTLRQVQLRRYCSGCIWNSSFTY